MFHQFLCFWQWMLLLRWMFVLIMQVLTNLIVFVMHPYLCSCHTPCVILILTFGVSFKIKWSYNYQLINDHSKNFHFISVKSLLYDSHIKYNNPLMLWWFMLLTTTCSLILLFSQPADVKPNSLFLVFFWQFLCVYFFLYLTFALWSMF